MKQLKRITDTYERKLVKITYCCAASTLYANAKPGTIHLIIKPPFGATNTAKGVWIKGKGDRPIQILSDEFIHLKLKRIWN